MNPVAAAAAVSPENVLKVRIRSPHPGPTESDSRGLRGPIACFVLTNPPDSNAS